MKNGLLIAAIVATALCGCAELPKAGTSKRLDNGGKIEVSQYFYTDNGDWVYVARFKDQPQVSTTTWFEQRGKVITKHALVQVDSTYQLTKRPVK